MHWVYLLEPPAAAVDPAGKEFQLSNQGKAARALFLLAAVWWVSNAVPAGVTAIAIGVFQALFAIRPAKEAFSDFMDPAVGFIFGSIVIGVAFTKPGLTHRLAYKMLTLVGLGVFILTMTNIIMNVAAMAISLPVALVMAGYLGVDPHVVLFLALTAAGMPFLFLVGAAPNAIAFQSEQFTPWEFLKAGLVASAALMAVLVLAITVIWPLLGLPILAGPG